MGVILGELKLSYLRVFFFQCIYVYLFWQTWNTDSTRKTEMTKSEFKSLTSGEVSNSHRNMSLSLCDKHLACAPRATTSELRGRLRGGMASSKVWCAPQLCSTPPPPDPGAAGNNMADHCGIMKLQNESGQTVRATAVTADERGHRRLKVSFPGALATRSFPATDRLQYDSDSDVHLKL